MLPKSQLLVQSSSIHIIFWGVWKHDPMGPMSLVFSWSFGQRPRIVSKEEEAEAIKDLPAMDPSAVLYVFETRTGDTQTTTDTSKIHSISIVEATHFFASPIFKDENSVCGGWISEFVSFLFASQYICMKKHDSWNKRNFDCNPIKGHQWTLLNLFWGKEPLLDDFFDLRRLFSNSSGRWRRWWLPLWVRGCNEIQWHPGPWRSSEWPDCKELQGTARNCKDFLDEKFSDRFARISTGQVL